MANTFKQINSVIAGAGGVTDILFSSIPQTYDDLIIYLNLKTNTSGRVSDNPTLRFNGDTTISNYVGRIQRGNGSTVAAGGSTGYNGLYVGEVGAGSTASGYFTPIRIYIPNYISGNRKAVSFHTAHERFATESYLQLGSGLYITSNAITSISIINHQGGNFLEGSSAYLYGINNS